MAVSIHVRDGSLAYGGQPVFSQLQLDVLAGKWTALLGASGVGKSSLLRMLAGLTTKEETISGHFYTNNNLPLHSQIAYMAQTDLLLPWFTVLQNACLGESLRAGSRDHYANSTKKACALLHDVGLGQAIHAYPSQLSGGMRQRVALVRTLMENKPIVLMDEPFSALDTMTRYKLQALAITLLKNKTVLFITHDPSEALRLADSIYVMQGQPAQLQPVASLSSPTPRPLHDPTLIQLHAELYQALFCAMQGAA